MPYEVVNTSVARGLTSAHSGFCDVLRTRGLPEEITPLLAPLNFYNEKLARGKPAYGVRSIRFGGRMWGVVSRVVLNGNDYTGRQNRLAHHVIAPPSELEMLCPAAVLAGYSFRDTCDEAPRYLDREPELPEIAGSFDDVWECMGGKGWRSHIAALALSGSRVVVLIPPSAEGRSVVISILLGIPLQRRWEVGVVEASSAEQCWAHSALIRVLAMDANDAEGDRSWPGEVVVDLRRQSIPPSAKQELIVGQQATKLDFSAFAATPQELSASETEKSSQPIVVDIDFGSETPEGIDDQRDPSSGEYSTQSTPSVGSSKVFWKQTIVWFILGTVVGALAGFFIVNLK